MPEKVTTAFAVLRRFDLALSILLSNCFVYVSDLHADDLLVHLVVSQRLSKMQRFALLIATLDFTLIFLTAISFVCFFYTGNLLLLVLLPLNHLLALLQAQLQILALSFPIFCGVVYLGSKAEVQLK